MIKEIEIQPKKENKYGKYFLAFEADEIQIPPIGDEPAPEENPDDVQVPTIGEEPPAPPIIEEQPSRPRNMKIIEIKPRRIERFKLTDPDEDDMFDFPQDDMSSPMDSSTDNGGIEIPLIGDEAIPDDLPPVPDLTGEELPPPPPVIGEPTQGEEVPSPPPIEGGAGETPPPPPDLGAPNPAPATGTELVPPTPTPDAGTTPPPIDVNAPTPDMGTTPPPTGGVEVPPLGGDMSGDGAPMIDEQPPDFGSDLPPEEMPPDQGGTSNNGPGLEYDSTRKYILFKNFLSLSNAIDNYISKLEASMGTDTTETLVLKNATDKLREINDLCYDYITMKFEISTYIQSLFFFQNLVVMVQKVFELLSKTKKKLQNEKNAKKH